MAADHNTFANLIWQIADLLRGPYRPPQYERVMLPMTVLRRFDCVHDQYRQARPSGCCGDQPLAASALFGNKERAGSLLVIPCDPAAVTPVQSDSFRSSSAPSTDPFGSPIPRRRPHTQSILQIVICDAVKLRPCTRSDRAELRT
jgi:hypothetical protein